VLGHSSVTINWETGPEDVAGTYRIKYYGDAKPLIGNIRPFEGTSGEFTLV
jgi:neutral ceramidase